jgi:hypothetical protein
MLALADDRLLQGAFPLRIQPLGPAQTLQAQALQPQRDRLITIGNMMMLARKPPTAVSMVEYSRRPTARSSVSEQYVQLSQFNRIHGAEVSASLCATALDLCHLHCSLSPIVAVLAVLARSSTANGIHRERRAPPPPNDRKLLNNRPFLSPGAGNPALDVGSDGTAQLFYSAHVHDDTCSACWHTCVSTISF